MCGDNTNAVAAEWAQLVIARSRAFVPTYRTPSVKNVERKRKKLSAMEVSIKRRRREVVDERTWWMDDARLEFM